MTFYSFFLNTQTLTVILYTLYMKIIKILFCIYHFFWFFCLSISFFSTIIIILNTLIKFVYKQYILIFLNNKNLYICNSMLSIN